MGIGLIGDSRDFIVRCHMNHYDLGNIAVYGESKRAVSDLTSALGFKIKIIDNPKKVIVLPREDSTPRQITDTGRILKGFQGQVIIAQKPIEYNIYHFLEHSELDDQQVIGFIGDFEAAVSRHYDAEVYGTTKHFILKHNPGRFKRKRRVKEDKIVIKNEYDNMALEERLDMLIDFIAKPKRAVKAYRGRFQIQNLNLFKMPEINSIEILALQTYEDYIRLYC